jgi:hypothetical protein
MKAIAEVRFTSFRQSNWPTWALQQKPKADFLLIDSGDLHDGEI